MADRLGKENEYEQTPQRSWSSRSRASGRNEKLCRKLRRLRRLRLLFLRQKLKMNLSDFETQNTEANKVDNTIFIIHNKTSMCIILHETAGV